MTDTTFYSIPQEPGRLRAIALAALVHVALLAFLWIGVRWQNETPVAVEAEVWSLQPQEAAPEPKPQPEPKIVEQPPEKPEPPPVKVIPQPPVVAPTLPNPDIALQQEKKRKAQERLAEELREKNELKQKAEKEALKKIAEEKQLAKMDAEAKQKREAEEAKAAEKNRKLSELETKAADKRRQEDLNRMLSQAGTGGTGTAAKAQGSRADAAYGQRVGAKIKSNTVFNAPEELAGNPAVEYEINLLPDGNLRGMRKTKSSGIPAFDEAVRRAIDKSAPYPADPSSGTVPSSFILTHKPKDQ